MMHYLLEDPFFPESSQEPENPVHRVKLAGDLGRKLKAHVEGRRSKGIMVLGTLKVGKSTAIGQLRRKADEDDNVLMTHSLDSFQDSFTVSKLDEIFTGQKTLPTTYSEVIHWLWWFAKTIVALRIKKIVRFATQENLAKPSFLDRLTWYGKELEFLKKSAVIFIDDFHKVEKSELQLLSKVFHMTEKHNLPILFVIAGLPRMLRIAEVVEADLVSAFDVHILTWLDDEQSRSMIEKTARDHGREFSTKALEEIVRLSKGSPYLLQLLGRESWIQTESDVITSQDVIEASDEVRKILTRAHFREMWEEIGSVEMKFALAMASLPSENRSLEKIKSCLGEENSSHKNTASKLIDNDIIHTVDDGKLEFTLPFFDEYIMKRARNEEELG